MKAEVWGLGGTGRTGREVAANLAARGVATVLVGRELEGKPWSSTITLRWSRPASRKRVVREGADPGELAGFLSGVTVLPVIEDRVLTWTRRLPAGREVSTRAVLAWGALEKTYPNRLRACADHSVTGS